MNAKDNSYINIQSWVSNSAPSHCEDSGPSALRFTVPTFPSKLSTWTLKLSTRTLPPKQTSARS